MSPMSPVSIVQKLLLQAGVSKINYMRNYRNDPFCWRELLQQKQVPLQQVPFSQRQPIKLTYRVSSHMNDLIKNLELFVNNELFLF